MIKSFAIVAFLVCACLCAAQSDSTTRITLSFGRKIKVSDRYLLTTSASYRMRLAYDVKGRPSIDSTYADSVRLQALVDVTSVTETGEEYAKTLTVRYFHRFVNNARIDVLPTGAVIGATFDGPSPTFLVNGTKPTTEIEELLRLAVRSEGGTTTGAILNPSKPVRIGDSWTVNLRAFAAAMSDSPKSMPIKGLTGKVRFVSVDVVKGKPSATVIAAVRQKSRVSNKQSPTHTNAYDITVTVPIDARYPASASKVRSRVRVDSRGKGLKTTQETDITIESTFDR